MKMLNGAGVTRIYARVNNLNLIVRLMGWKVLKKAIYDWFCYFPTNSNLSSPVCFVNSQSKFRAQVVIMHRVEMRIIRERVLLRNDGQGMGSC